MEGGEAVPSVHDPPPRSEGYEAGGVQPPWSPREGRKTHFTGFSCSLSPFSF